MDEYIKRGKANEAIKKERDYFGKFSYEEEESFMVGYQQGITFALSDIASIPAADVRPVVKAAWEQVEVRYEDELIDNPVQAVASMFCPNCQRYHNEVYFYGMPTERINFCPNCGADMREKPAE